AIARGQDIAVDDSRGSPSFVLGEDGGGKAVLVELNARDGGSARRSRSRVHTLTRLTARLHTGGLTILVILCAEREARNGCPAVRVRFSMHALARLAASPDPG